MAEKLYPKGIKIFKPRDGAPSFVKGQIIIGINQLTKFFKENPEHLADFKGDKQLKLDLLEGKDGLYAIVNTYKKQAARNTEDQDLPF